MHRLSAALWASSLILVACGPPVEDNPPPAPTGGETEEPTPSEVVIRVNNGPREGETQRQEEWDLKIALFEERHPGIRVEVTDWEYDPQGFAARSLSGDLETVINTWATEGFRTIEEGLAQDLTDLLETWEHGGELDPQILAPYTRDGRVYAMPIYAYSMALFFDRRIFTEQGIVDESGEPRPPATWEEFLETAQRLTDSSTGRCGYLLVGEVPLGGWHSLNWGWQAGGEYERLGDDGLWHAAFASEEIATAFRFLQSLRWEHGVMPPSISIRQREAWQMFAAGQVGMMLDAASEHIFNTLRDEYDYDVTNLFVAPLPAGPGGRAHQVGADYLIVTPGATEQQRQAAFQWMIWHHDPEWLEAKWSLWRAQGRAVGYPAVPVLHGPLGDLQAELVERNRTYPRFPAYEEGIVGTLHTEPPVACQALYREVLSPTLQTVLGSPDEDPLPLLERLAESFERDHIAPFNAQLTASTE
ncbi:extracellular solute-binding protein [Candidatus Sumerlaeota bacterium]|nr:extracellular solute-binding protein [Candidatus Sumerlaeota bacterium]